jgi:hypothetical protein
MQKLSVGSNKPSYTAGPTPKIQTETLSTADSPVPVQSEPVNPLQTSPIQKGPTIMRSKKNSLTMMSYVVIGLAIGAGIFTGLGAVRLSAKSGGNPITGAVEPISQVAGDNVKNGDVFGSNDESAFKDSAEGYLEIGGIDGEGTHKLIREGGVSQTVYLTSSVTDLDKFDGMNVRIWGETFKAQKAGWLMDVGRVQVIDIQGTAPGVE